MRERKTGINKEEEDYESKGKEGKVKEKAGRVMKSCKCGKRAVSEEEKRDDDRGVIRRKKEAWIMQDEKGSNGCSKKKERKKNFQKRKVI